MSEKNRETTSIKVRSNLWKEAKKYCIDNNITLSQFIEKLIESKINKNKGIKK